MAREGPANIARCASKPRLQNPTPHGACLALFLVPSQRSRSRPGRAMPQRLAPTEQGRSLWARVALAPAVGEGPAAGVEA